MTVRTSSRVLSGWQHKKHHSGVTTPRAKHFFSAGCVWHGRRVCVGNPIVVLFSFGEAEPEPIVVGATLNAHSEK